MGSFVKYLPELGWQATVLSAADTVSYPKDYSTLAQVPDWVEVHRVGHRERPKRLQALLNRLRINMDFPDSFKGWYGPALQESRNIIHSQKIDAIFSYGPPYTAHFVAMQLKQEFKIPWIVGMADLWSGNTFLLDALISPLRAWQTYRIQAGERRLLENADRVMVRCWDQQRQLCAWQSISQDAITVINHGYDESDFADLKPYALYPDKLTVTYLGSFYQQYREPFMTLFEGLGQVSQESEVILIGQGVNVPNVNSDRLTRILYLPQKKAMALGGGSDFLLVLMPPTARWTMMKLYDYLRLGKPILALVPEDGDIARIIREARAGFILSYDPVQMQQQLRTIVDDWRQGKFKDFKPDPAYVAQLERGILTRQLVNIFDELTA